MTDDMTINDSMPANEHTESINTAPSEQASESPSASAHPKKIFVVQSERDDLNTICFNALKRHGVTPIILNLPEESRSLLEILNQNPAVCFALIILSGDDFIYDRLSGKPGEAHLGAKQNAVFHLGFLLAKFGNIGTLTVYREQKSFHLPTGFQHTAFIPCEKNGKWEDVLSSKFKTLHII